ncbi:MAG TPA: DNA mismatch repair endonuclease MutL [Pirellulales bacterium]|jgi:DNA mismatch repair protein MutL|nr:DNA mismatch repair endonuclease MutL [Pirellulales bacterium]
MSAIRQLPSSVVNKIAAGEVIERPASVVKELMENSIDAGATRIDVVVEQGGLELIRVSDNGSGIPADELTLAVTSHATSKISDADDLFCVQTLGFRGEALASIAEVSRLLLRTRVASAEAGHELEVNGGQSSGVAPCGAPVGTTVEIRQLFFNTPVRRKFLRSTQTEMSHIAEAFTRLALANPHVHCTLSHNGRSQFDLPPAGHDWRGRIAAFFGHDLAADLIGVSSTDDEVRLEGFVASPSHSRGNARLQYLFLNGRAIRDRSLQHALGEAFRGLLLTGRYPIAFLQIQMPAELVDVNVHPTKLEVRFQESGKLYSQLLGTLRTKFLTSDLTARLRTDNQHEAALALDGDQADLMRRELVDWAKGQLTVSDQFAPADTARASQAMFEVPLENRAPLELSVLEPRPSAAATSGGAARTSANSAYRVDEPSPASRPPAGLQLHNRYLIAESGDGMVVIDQHALHERILYEHLREKVLTGAIETQALLVGEPVDLTPAEATAVLEAHELLAKLGLAIEPFGGSTVLVSSYPAMLANFRPADVLRDLATQLLGDGKRPESRDILDSLLHMISCKAAIKAGDRLSQDEIMALLEQRHLARDTHHCPHGRPTALYFSRDDLDKQFKRT